MRLTRPLILASASPRRAELLAQVGIPFTILPSHIEEPAPLPGSDVADWAMRGASDKARASADLLAGAAPSLVLGADTTVLLPAATAQNLPLLHGRPVRVMGKPVDARDANRMLQQLSGREHIVLSAFALYSFPEGTVVAEAVETRVKFRDLTLAEIEEYIATGEPLDKAGAYGIQGHGALLIEEIHGDYYTVVGLPLNRLWQRLQAWR